MKSNASGFTRTPTDVHEVRQQLNRVAETANRLDVYDDNVSSPPTDAQLDAAIGTPAAKGVGYIAAVNDAGAGTSLWLVFSDGTNWWYGGLTKAV